jgi:hypothetical protein
MSRYSKLDKRVANRKKLGGRYGEKFGWIVVEGEVWVCV